MVRSSNWVRATAGDKVTNTSTDRQTETDLLVISVLNISVCSIWMCSGKEEKKKRRVGQAARVHASEQAELK